MIRCTFERSIGSPLVQVKIFQTHVMRTRTQTGQTKDSRHLISKSKDNADRVQVGEAGHVGSEQGLMASLLDYIPILHCGCILWVRLFIADDQLLFADAYEGVNYPTNIRYPRSSETYQGIRACPQSPTKRNATPARRLFPMSQRWR